MYSLRGPVDLTHGTTIAWPVLPAVRTNGTRNTARLPDGFVRRSCPIVVEYRKLNRIGAPRITTALAGRPDRENHPCEGPIPWAGSALNRYTGGGVITPFRTALGTRCRKFCRKYDVLLCTSRSRLWMSAYRRMFGYQHIGVQPDLWSQWPKASRRACGGSPACDNRRRCFNLFKDDAMRSDEAISATLDVWALYRRPTRRDFETLAIIEAKTCCKHLRHGAIYARRARRAVGTNFDHRAGCAQRVHVPWCRAGAGRSTACQCRSADTSLVAGLYGPKVADFGRPTPSVPAQNNTLCIQPLR